MSFWRSLERNVFRPVGRVAKAAAPIAGTVAGTALGGPLGGAIGSTLGGMAKRGKVDFKHDAMNFGGGLLMGGVAGKLGIPGMGGGGGGGGGASQLLKNNPLGAAAIRGATGNTGGGMNVGRSFMSGVGNFLKDGKNLKAIGDTALGAYGAVQDERTAKIEREREERRRMMEDQDRQRSQAMDPARAQLLAMIMQRLGGSMQGGGMQA
jgi:hypothetical protein